MDKKSKAKYVIIGSGPAGLGAAYRLKDLGETDYVIIERNPWVGGLATSFVDEKGFTWDVGGHVQFSHYPYFDKTMEEAIPNSEWLTHERESWVWMYDRFVPYPFQNNIRYLPRDAMWSCLKGLIDVALEPAAAKPSNFKEWILASFGQGVADEFMIPYNFKVWAYPPEDMAYQWIGERVATVNVRRILENIVYEKMDASWGPNNTFKFPLNGGTGGIWNSVAKLVGLEKIRTETSAVEISAAEKTISLSDGTAISYEHLLSTVPLDILAGMVKECPPEIRSKARELKHSSSNIVGVGIEGRPIESLKTKCWMYFPESSCPFYRMTVFSNYSPRNVPDIDRHYSLMCEVSESPKKPVDRSRVVQETIDGLKKNNLLADDNKIVSTWLYTAEYGYPTPSLDRDEILAQVIPVLDDLGVYSRGRFGGWKYEVSNQDHTFMQGVEWVNKIIQGKEEETFRVDTNRDPNLTVLKRA